MIAATDDCGVASGRRWFKQLPVIVVEHLSFAYPDGRVALQDVSFRIEPGETVGEHVGLIVVPNQEALDTRASEEKKALNEAKIADLIRSEVKRLSADIADFKRPRRIQIRWEEFDKTSTGKVKRYLYSLDTSDVA